MVCERERTVPFHEAEDVEVYMEWPWQEVSWLAWL